MGEEESFSEFLQKVIVATREDSKNEATLADMITSKVLGKFFEPVGWEVDHIAKDNELVNGLIGDKSRSELEKWNEIIAGKRDYDEAPAVKKRRISTLEYFVRGKNGSFKFDFLGGSCRFDYDFKISLNRQAQDYPGAIVEGFGDDLVKYEDLMRFYHTLQISDQANMAQHVLQQLLNTMGKFQFYHQYCMPWTDLGCEVVGARKDLVNNYGFSTTHPLLAIFSKKYLGELAGDEKKAKIVEYDKENPSVPFSVEIAVEGVFYDQMLDIISLLDSHFYITQLIKGGFQKK